MLASVSVKVWVVVAGAEGVPLSAPVLGANMMPAGSDPPVTVQVYGVFPPLPVSAELYSWVVYPSGSGVGMMVHGERTWMLRLCVAWVPLLSVTLTTKGDDPGGPLGVPLKVPVELIVSPAGGTPEATVKLYGDRPPATVTETL